MADKIRRFDPTLQRRPAPARGPRSSEDWTDSWDEIIRDLEEISNQWNIGILGLIETLPDGTDDSSVDAFTNGVDGRTLYVDSSVDSSSDPDTYYDSSKDRPKTVKESLGDLYDYIDDSISNLQTDISSISVSAALTTEQKQKIGANIFDTSETSSATSLDGKSERNRVNVIQLATDLYGSTYTLDNDGVANLTNSVRAMVGALLAVHGGNWDDDIGLVHSGIDLVQTDVSASVTVNDSFSGGTSDLQDDLNQIRTRIKTVVGGATWSSALPALYTGGATTLKGILDSTTGSGVKSATNPWGYHYGNIDGLQSVVNAIGTFIGQDNDTDSSPNYSSNNYVTDSTSLETAIGALDAAELAGRNHSILSNLTADTHTQYLPLTGTRGMTGNLNMNGNNIYHLQDIGVNGNYTGSGYILTSGELKLTRIGSDPAILTNTGQVYTKLVGGCTELFFEDCAGRTIQITNSGEVSYTPLDDGYAEMYLLSSQDTSITSGGVYVQMSGVYTADELNEFTHTLGQLTYTGTKPKKFNVDINIAATSSNNEVYYYAVAVNNSVLVKTRNRRKTSATDVGSISVGGIINLNNGDTVQIHVTSTSDTTTLTALDCNCQISEV